MNEISYIMKLIQDGKAYAVNIPDIGEFVCADYSVNKKNLRPIVHNNVENFMKNKNDFVIWRPSHDGYISPWGIGFPSANLHVLCIF